MRTCKSSFKLGEQLMRVIQKKSRECGLIDPVPAILLVREEGETREQLALTYYERSGLPVNDPVSLVEFDDLEMLIIQQRLLDRLSGKTLEIVEHELRILPH